MYDDIRRPEVINHIASDIDFPLRPIRGRIQDHTRFRPEQFVGQAETDLLEEKDNETLKLIYL